MIQHHLITLAREMTQDRRSVQTVAGAWVFIVPDVNETPLRKECQILIAQIPDTLPDGERQGIELALLNIYKER